MKLLNWKTTPQRIGERAPGLLVLLLILLLLHLLKPAPYRLGAETIPCESPVYAQIKGEIRHPGVYSFCAPPTVGELIRKAGGLWEGNLPDPDLRLIPNSGITVKRVPDRPGTAALIFEPIFKAGIIVDMIVQNTSEDGSTDLTFTVPKADFQKSLKLVSEVAGQIGAEKVLGDENISKVSIVGVGMRNHAGVAQRMFHILAKENINIIMISTSEIKISCVIEDKYTELAVRVLHEAFELESGPTEDR